MSKPKNGKGPASAKVFRFSLPGLIALCLGLVAVSCLVSNAVVGACRRHAAGLAQAGPAATGQRGDVAITEGPWGELVTRDVTLERPAEYLNEDLRTLQPALWTFHGMNVAQVKAFLGNNGLTPPEVEKALTPDRVSVQGADTLFKPSDEFVLSLSPETRDRFYLAMRGLEVNLYIDSPYYYSQDQLESISRDTRVQPEDLALFKRLVYGGSAIRRFSDFETLMGRIPTLERRVGMAAALSRQNVVLAGLMVRPDTDIDKVALYWGNTPNVRFIDIRPMLEGIKGLPRGGTISLMYLLPPFARERLYTFPPCPAPGQPLPDAYWSTFNFSSVNSDNRFLDPAESARYAEANYYPIAQPGICGDVLLFRNPEGQIRHSAVYLAGDLVFTKLGRNCAMPWMIMHIADLQAMYSNCNIVYLRDKTD
jgi:hypothetical protein